jgi:hypothetical protein
VTIWTVVETATAIVAASIPVLRVFFKEAASSYNHSHGKSNNKSNAKTVPLSNISRSHRSNHTTTIQSISKGREGGWTSLDAIEDGIEDASSQRSILRDEEQGSQKGGPQVVVEHLGIMQTNTVTVTSDVNRRSQGKARSWLGAPNE